MNVCEKKKRYDPSVGWFHGYYPDKLKGSFEIYKNDWSMRPKKGRLFLDGYFNEIKLIEKLKEHKDKRKIK